MNYQQTKSILANIKLFCEEENVSLNKIVAREQKKKKNKLQPMQLSSLVIFQSAYTAKQPFYYDLPSSDEDSIDCDYVPFHEVPKPLRKFANPKISDIKENLFVYKNYSHLQTFKPTNYLLLEHIEKEQTIGNVVDDLQRALDFILFICPDQLSHDSTCSSYIIKLLDAVESAEKLAEIVESINLKFSNQLKLSGIEPNKEKSDQKEEPGYKIYVRNLPFTYQDQDLCDLINELNYQLDYSID